MYVCPEGSLQLSVLLSTIFKVNHPLVYSLFILYWLVGANRGSHQGKKGWNPGQFYSTKIVKTVKKNVFNTSIFCFSVGVWLNLGHSAGQLQSPWEFPVDLISYVVDAHYAICYFKNFWTLAVAASRLSWKPVLWPFHLATKMWWRVFWAVHWVRDISCQLLTWFCAPPFLNRVWLFLDVDIDFVCSLVRAANGFISNLPSWRRV